MILPYTAMPHGAPSRPLIDIEVDNSGVPIKGLIDTGAVNTLLDRWVAEDAGIDLTESEERPLRVGGRDYTGRFVTVSLACAGHMWEAEVGFCDDWQAGWALLGHYAFLRHFTLVVRAADLEFELEPIRT